MNVYLANATVGPRQHAGSAACTRSIVGRLRAGGHRLVQVHYVNSTPAPPVDQVDAVVVNGEGTMHHDRERARELLGLLQLAQRAGARTFLTNSIWQEMSAEHDATLARLDGFWVRDPWSWEATRRLGARLRLDSSCDVELRRAAAPYPGYAGQVALGQEWPLRDCEGIAGRRLRLLGRDFGRVVRTLETAAAYVTGQYHGVVAATLAGCRVVRRPCNDTWKVDAWLQWVGDGALSEGRVWQGLEDLE